MKNWQNILRSIIHSLPVSGISRAGVDQECVPLLLIQAALATKSPLVAAFPEMNSADRAAAECEAISELTGIKLRTLFIPEAGRGKLLFPGGEARRARALNAALTGEYDLVIGSVHALTAPAPPPEETRKAALVLKTGMEISPTALLEKLVALDYDDEYEATVSGEFARRGGIVDLFSPAHDFPCRVEFFGDEIDSLRGFSPETQRSTGEVAEYRVIGRAGITAGGASESDFFDYMAAKPYRLLAVYPEAGMERLRQYSGEKAAARLEELRESSGEQDSFFGFYEVNTEVPAAELTAPLPAEEKRGAFAPEARNAASELAKQLLAMQLNDALDEGFEVVLLAPHPENLPALKGWCERSGLDLNRLHFDSARLGHGFRYPAGKLLLITERELVSGGLHYEAALSEPEEEEASSAPAVNVPEFSLADLDYGDFAVHLDHGIGIFRGFKVLETRGIAREVLTLEYRDGQILYVPLLQAHKVSRYLGSPGKVQLHKLGGSKWDKDKEAAAKGVRSYAADMLRLQAMRQSLSGISFPRDEGECRAFVRAFPFSDTPDQKRSTVEVFKDMESLRPMDRLLCGDVGYGKTEIAMRAAFKAVAAGYQVAILAPTTVLVQQHFNSFLERFAEYPFTIEMLSRFRTGAEQNDVLRRTASGGVDILIGTHRICSAEVRFKNLGLVVIDEEQRFGVKHKERLRRYRAESDVLTMSATPIPRTLYLAMAGARDLSTLMTAPKLRLPVKTVIAPEEDLLIEQALRAELARGGQIYYLHNRVRTIEEKTKHLKELVPEARFAFAHGQMHEHELEEVMKRFLDGSIDCLVCSTIVESGLDVPNANTILIERADRFGLAELYQLRGRVGRWKHQAYAYMLLPRSQLVSTDARKRLAAIRRCSTLGAGFQLALRDLEIRGSGNLLGSEQSGHLNTIGFDLYCQLLKQEVAKLRGEKRDLFPEVDLGIDFVSFSLTAPAGQLAAAIPAEYIGGDRLRLDAYRRLAGLESIEELAEMQEELRDRFGPLPKQLKNLLEVTELRILAATARYEVFNVADGKVTLKNPGGVIHRVNGKQPVISYANPPELRLRHLRKILLDAVAERSAKLA